MEQYCLNAIGVIKSDDKGMYIQLGSVYSPAVLGLYGFSHLQVLWWFSGCDNSEDRGVLRESAPYVKGPPMLGTFATRSPRRPNPIALSCAEILHIDEMESTITLAYIDAQDDTPVLDIKPYTPSLDRVEYPRMPSWCAHWPKSLEQSGEFNWEEEFNF